MTIDDHMNQPEPVVGLDSQRCDGGQTDDRVIEEAAGRAVDERVDPEVANPLYGRDEIPKIRRRGKRESDEGDADGCEATDGDGVACGDSRIFMHVAVGEVKQIVKELNGGVEFECCSLLNQFILEEGGQTGWEIAEEIKRDVETLAQVMRDTHPTGRNLRWGWETDEGQYRGLLSEWIRIYVTYQEDRPGVVASPQALCWWSSYPYSGEPFVAVPVGEGAQKIRGLNSGAEFEGCSSVAWFDTEDDLTREEIADQLRRDVETLKHMVRRQRPSAHNLRWGWEADGDPDRRSHWMRIYVTFEKGPPSVLTASPPDNGHSMDDPHSDEEGCDDAALKPDTQGPTSGKPRGERR